MPQTSTLKHRNLPLLLLKARESVIARFRPILKEHGFTEQQWRIVRVLLDEGPLEPRQIGQLCNISSPSLAGVLARMETLGWVDRERLDHDQRRVRVSLTATSRRLAVRIAPRIEAVYEEMEAVLDLRFTTELYAALDRLVTTLGEAVEEEA